MNHHDFSRHLGRASATDATELYERLDLEQAAFDGSRVWLAWQIPPTGGAPNRVEVSQRPAP